MSPPENSMAGYPSTDVEETELGIVGSCAEKFANHCVTGNRPRLACGRKWTWKNEIPNGDELVVLAMINEYVVWLMFDQSAGYFKVTPVLVLMNDWGKETWIGWRFSVTRCNL
jgi:hypothetical protein